MHQYTCTQGTQTHTHAEQHRRIVTNEYTKPEIERERKKKGMFLFIAYISERTTVIRLMQNYINASKFCCLNFASSFHSLALVVVPENGCVYVLHLYFFRMFVRVVRLMPSHAHCFSCMLCEHVCVCV